MRALNRKLLRDLLRMPAQGITIAVVMALGMGSFIGNQSTYRSLVRSRDAYYAESNFGDVFARVVSAPRTVLPRLEAIPGVARVEGRVTDTVRVEVEGFDEAAHGTFTSAGAEGMNTLHLREGAPLARDDEVLIGEAFAKAHGLHPGDWISAIFNGRRTRLRVAGIALSPEYVWVMTPGAFWTDDKRTGVFWMRYPALSSALGQGSSVNDVSLTLAQGASVEAVKTAVDRILEPYGSFGAFARDKQPSNRLVNGELQQLRTMATILPLIFLAVAAFLVNVVLSRVVATQREQIASLRALGYTRAEVAGHYGQIALAIVGLGAALGVGIGALLGGYFIGLYTQYFRFPELTFHLEPSLIGVAAVVTVGAGLAGALASVARVMRLAPAEAMRPEPPIAYHRSLVEQVGLARLLTTLGRMVIRDVVRRPVRLGLSALGIAMATSVLVAGYGAFDAITGLFDLQFNRVQREDLEVAFARPLGPEIRRSIASLPGVHRAEFERRAPIRLRAGHRSRELVLQGVKGGAELRQLLDQRGNQVHLTDEGIALSLALGKLLDVAPGDEVEVELLQGQRLRRKVTVTTLIDDSLGLMAYMDEPALARFLSEGGLADAALLQLDPQRLAEVERRLLDLPMVIAITRPSTGMELFREQMAQMLLTWQTVLAICAGAIAIGVVYNNARIAISTRARDLATMRILGFRRREVAGVLVGEQTIQLGLGIPLGLLFGAWLAGAIYAALDPELYRITVRVSGHTRAVAALVVIVAGALGALVIRRAVRRMDLVAVLKARD